jgi:hypothetical protein
MSVADLKRIVDGSTPKERQFLRAYLTEAYPEDDTFDPVELDRRMKEMDAGKVVRWDELVKAHEELKAKGQ